MREYRDSALMAGRVRVVVNQCVQAGTCRHCAQQQDKTHQERSEDHLAMAFEMSNFQLQTFFQLGLIAKRVPNATSFQKTF